MRHRLWLCFKMNFCHLLPHNWGPKTWSKDTVGIFPRDLLRAPTGDPVESGHLESWNRGVTIKIMGISWMIYWEYHSPTLGSKDVPNISPIHVFTHLHQCIFSDCSMIHTFLEWCSMFFHGRSIPPHLLSPNGACSPSRLGRVATSGLLQRVWAAWSAPRMVPDGACWTPISQLPKTWTGNSRMVWIMFEFICPIFSRCPSVLFSGGCCRRVHK